jgi:uncharacterized DUF497 family protein
MGELAFEWDRTKATTNLEKHGVSFDEAATVFRNPLAMVLPDPTHAESEERAIMLGHSDRSRLLLVIFTERGDRIRIISARCASRRERSEYEEHS